MPKRYTKDPEDYVTVEHGRFVVRFGAITTDPTVYFILNEDYRRTFDIWAYVPGRKRGQHINLTASRRSDERIARPRTRESAARIAVQWAFILTVFK